MPREIVIDGTLRPTISLLRWGMGDLRNISCKPTRNENEIFHRSNITALNGEVDLEKNFCLNYITSLCPHSSQISKMVGPLWLYGLPIVHDVYENCFCFVFLKRTFQVTSDNRPLTVGSLTSLGDWTRNFASL